MRIKTQSKILHYAYSRFGDMSLYWDRMCPKLFAGHIKKTCGRRYYFKINLFIKGKVLIPK